MSGVQRRLELAKLAKLAPPEEMPNIDGCVTELLTTNPKLLTTNNYRSCITGLDRVG